MLPSSDFYNNLSTTFLSINVFLNESIAYDPSNLYDVIINPSNCSDILSTLMTLSLQVRSIAIVHALTNSPNGMELESPVSFVRYFSAYLNIILRAVSLNFQFNAIKPNAIFLPKIFSISRSYGLPSSTSISESYISINFLEGFTFASGSTIY